MKLKWTKIIENADFELFRCMPSTVFFTIGFIVSAYRVTFTVKALPLISKKMNFFDWRFQIDVKTENSWTSGRAGLMKIA